MRSKWFLATVAILITLSMVVSCATPTPEVVKEVVTQIVTQVVKETVKETVIVAGTAQVVEKEVTKIVEVEKIVTATPEPVSVGGTLRYGINMDPDTLDSTKTVFVTVNYIVDYFGSSLLAVDLDGELVPYLAESWTVSEDGLTMDFTLRKDVKFHDGTPLTAHDYAWTFTRIIDPENKTGAILLTSGLESAEALDDFTLRLKLKQPYYPFMLNLTSTRLQPQPQHAVEEMGEDAFARKPIGVGPYMVKEWVTEEKVVLERNPDFNWGPAHFHQGPRYFDTIEFHIVPEPATRLAALQAGEIDTLLTHLAVEARDVPRLTDAYDMAHGMQPGAVPVLFMNMESEPFGDVLVRRAFNLALDKEFMIESLLDGAGTRQHGPINEAVPGYWPGVEELSYGYDLEQAKALMQEAGFTYNSEGMAEKDGVPLQLRLHAGQASGDLASLVQENLKQLGVETTIELHEGGVFLQLAKEGNYDMQLRGYGASDANIMVLFFHSKHFGGPNLMRITDDEMDEILGLTQTTMDPVKRQEYVIEAQKMILDKAYGAFLYVATRFVPVSKRIEGAIWSEVSQKWLFDDAYIAD